MIQFPRSLARQVRAVFRRLVSRGNPAKLSLTAGRGGLFVRLHGTEILAQYHVDGDLPPEVLAIPFDAFAAFEGRRADVVTVETTEAGKVQARWNDSGVPQLVDYEATALPELPTYPLVPETMKPLMPGFLQALADASQCAARDFVRYATHLQLRGAPGTIVGTDGRQLLIQAGFEFPWQDDVLIPASPVFGCKELPHEPVSLAKSDAHVTLQAGPWTLHLPIDKHGRYPSVNEVIPKPSRVVAGARLGPEDLAYLDRALLRLPGGDEDHAPVTIDLNDAIYIRARGEGQNRVTELALTRSQSSGRPLRFAVNRGFLRRALHLNLAEIQAVDANTPVLFKDAKRQYVVMPLGKDTALAPRDDAIRLSTTEATTANQLPTPQRSNPVNQESPATGIPKNGAANDTTPAIATPNGTNGTSAPAHGRRRRKSKSTGITALIEEAEALKTSLRTTFARSHALLVALKRHKKQSQIVQSTLKSLKELQSVE